MANPILNQLAQNPEFAPQVQGIERQRRMAEMLMQQGMNQPQGQNVSGIYVAPSWTQHLEGLANIWAGKGIQEESEQKQLDLARQYRQAGQQELVDLLRAKQGTPEQRIAQAGPPTDEMIAKQQFNPEQVIPAKAPMDPLAWALKAASAQYSPVAQALGTESLKQQFREPKWETKGIYNEKTGNTDLFLYNVNSQNPEQSMRFMGTEKPGMTAADKARLSLEAQKFTYETGQTPNFGNFAVSSGMGQRIDPVTGKPNQTHNGFDVKIPTNTPLTPLTAPEFNQDVGGKVLRTVPSAQSGGYGNMVEIQRTDGTVARYAHLNNINVKQGETVTPATVYGNPGSTGKSTGVHVHYEVAKPQGMQVASTTNMGMLSPKQQQEVVGGVAKKQAETQATGEQNALKAYDVIKKAETLLPQASSGGLQAGMTAANRFFGKSTPASQADAQLEALGSQLTLMVPRMEGPQGVLDLKLYQGAAADVANKALPYQDRLAALGTLKELHKKYAPNLDWSFGKDKAQNEITNDLAAQARAILQQRKQGQGVR